MAPGSRLQELTAKYMQNPRRFFVPLANEYRMAGDLDRAIALCREHLPAQPGHMSGHIVLGRAYFEKGDLDAARDVFLTSVSLDDENLIALRHLGDIARARFDATEARGWYARVLDADPENREIEQLLRSLDTLQAPEPAAQTDVAPVEPASVPVEAPQAVLTPVDEPIIVPEESALLDVAPVEPAVPAVTLGELASALNDPTPPGLRAILGEDDSPAFDASRVRVPEPAPPPAKRPLETFDLSSLGAAMEAEIDGGFGALDVPPTPAMPAPQAAPAPEPATVGEEFGITVEGGGFAFHDLDELVEPVTGEVPDTLPPIEEADFSTGVDTPSTAPVQPETDELLSRPVFGALASFQSWRSSQERETPAKVTPQPPVTTPAPTPEMAATVEEERELFWQNAASDSAATAPEFVTETMAALYAQQGFTRQALDIYRTLLERNPSDAGIAQKVQQLQAALAAPVMDASLEEDADKALEFGDLHDAASPEAGTPSMLEAMYDASPVTDSDPLSEAFGTAWTPAADEGLSGGDDWFADAADAPAGAFAEDGSELFGFSLDAFSATPAPSEPTRAARPNVTMAVVLGATAVAAADDTAADMLSSLAEQMVGRLPKEPPTLPVPDVLELPSAVAGDEVAGTSPAPLLSFDRFFSGSGSPPRPRVDTPVRPTAITPRDLPAAPSMPSPSLSPTFGGVPVIPPPAPTTAPSWAGFDKFVPPSAPASPRVTPPSERPVGSTPQPPMPTPTGAFWTPAAVPVIPETPRPVTPPSAARPVTPPSVPPVAPPPIAAEEAEPPRRTPPSEFHAWLEGLS